MMIYLQQNNLITSSEPTVWDGDDDDLPPTEQLDYEFRAHRVGWRPSKYAEHKINSLSSEPTVWDGDTGLFLLAFFLAIGSEPTVWDGDTFL